MGGGGILARVLLPGVAERGHVGAAEERVRVEAHLRVERDEVARPGDDERVDLDHRRVAVAEGAVAAAEHLPHLRDLRALQPEAEGEFAGREVGEAHGGVDHHAQ